MVPPDYRLYFGKRKLAFIRQILSRCKLPASYGSRQDFCNKFLFAAKFIRTFTAIYKLTMKVYAIQSHVSHVKRGENVKKYFIEQVMTVSEAAKLWGKSRPVVYLSTISRNGAPPRFHDDEMKKSGSYTLLTIDGMRRLYGEPVLPLPEIKSEERYSLSDFASLTEVSVVLHRDPVTLRSLYTSRVQKGHGFTKKLDDTQYKKSGRCLIFPLPVVLALYNKSFSR